MQKIAASVPRAEKIIRRAYCLASDSEGDIVRISGPKSGRRLQVVSGDVTSSTGVPAIGVIIRKLSDTDCFVQMHGVCSVHSGLTPGKSYYVGTDSRPAGRTDPNYPSAGGTTFFQQIGVATDTDELLVDPGSADLGGIGRYFGQTLIGSQNGSNLVFLTPVPFVHGGVSTEKLYWNGVLLEEGSGSDYVASESSPGAGYNTITMAVPPLSQDNLVIDFVPDL